MCGILLGAASPAGEAPSPSAPSPQNASAANVTDDDLEAILAVAPSIAAALRQLRRACVGSNYRWLRRQAKRIGFDLTGLSGRRHGPSGRPRLALEALLVASSDRQFDGKTKRRLIRAGLLSEACAICNLPPLWQDQRLVLRLDHINGDRRDSRLINLRLLCPNCDSQTPTFCGRNARRQRRSYQCARCSAIICAGSTHCRGCALALRAPQSKIVWPHIDTLVAMVQSTSIAAVARHLGVSWPAVKKHLARHSPSGKAVYSK